MRTTWWLAVVMGCGGHPLGPPPSPTPTPAKSASLGADERLLAEVAALRRLAVRAPVPVVRVGGAEWPERYGALARSETKRHPHHLDVLLAFDRLDALFSGAGAMVPALEEAGSLFRSDAVAGFHDHGTVYLRVADEPDAALETATLVHEMVHALRAQAFAEPEGLSPDRRLALQALQEGDATLVAASYARRTSGAHTAIVPAMLGMATALADVRTEDRLAYGAGTAFAATLAYVGGTALLDEAHREPPASSEQILHPAAYLAGEQPVRVATPLLPEDYALLVAQEAGELGVRQALERCVPAALVPEAAAGWGGDTFAVGRRADGQTILLWSTAWDSPQDADQFAGVLAEHRACRRPFELGPERWMGAGFEFRAERERVVVVRGLDDDGDAQRALDRMLRQPLEHRTPHARVDKARLALAQAPDTQPTPLLIDGRYEDPWAGVGAAIPAGAVVHLPSDELGRAWRIMIVPQRDDRAEWAAMVLFFAAPPDDEMRSLVARSLARAASADLGEPGEARVVASSLGPASVRAWPITTPESEGALRVLLLDACRGEGTLVVGVVDRPSTHDAADAWLETLARRPPTSPSACDFIDPLP